MVSPFNIQQRNNQLLVQQVTPVTFVNSYATRFSVFTKSGIGIASSFFTPEKPLQGTEKEIIEQIHAIRYAQTNPYVITGGHFHQLYVRNLGIFFNSLLDPRIPSTEKDWLQRQSIVLKTLVLDLEVFRLAKKDFTTIVPLSKNQFTGMNIYTRPSDSLFAIVYTLCTLVDETFIVQRFPTQKSVKLAHQLQTKHAAKNLLKQYKATLQMLIEQYIHDILDTKTNLIKKDILLASARDGIKRNSSFYDNVIAWSTVNLATKLDSLSTTRTELIQWKQIIIKAFWDEKEGIFLDDLSSSSLKEKRFSADSFIVTSTGFLSIQDKNEAKCLHRMIAYVQKHHLDVPFPLQYSKENNESQLYWPVRYFAPSYMGQSIWSHWGMEYIKTLIMLAKEKNDYNAVARQHLEKYKQNIETFSGYPELYDLDGKPLATRVYKSVLHNGWVINYQQAKMLLHHSR